MKRPAHRPPLEPGQRRDVRIVVQVRPSTAERWREAAGVTHDSLAAFIRDAVDAIIEREAHSDAQHRQQYAIAQLNGDVSSALKAAEKIAELLGLVTDEAERQRFAREAFAMMMGGVAASRAERGLPPAVAAGGLMSNPIITGRVADVASLARVLGRMFAPAHGETLHVLALVPAGLVTRVRDHLRLAGFTTCADDRAWTYDSISVDVRRPGDTEGRNYHAGIVVWSEFEARDRVRRPVVDRRASRG